VVATSLQVDVDVVLPLVDVHETHATTALRTNRSAVAIEQVDELLNHVDHTITFGQGSA
jgi:hypothetical protein